MFNVQWDCVGAMTRRGAEHIGTRQARDKSVIETLSAPVLEEIRQSDFMVIWSFGHLVKIVFQSVKIATIYKYIYI